MSGLLFMLIVCFTGFALSIWADFLFCAVPSDLYLIVSSIISGVAPYIIHWLIDWLINWLIDWLIVVYTSQSNNQCIIKWSKPDCMFYHYIVIEHAMFFCFRCTTSNTGMSPACVLCVEHTTPMNHCKCAPYVEIISFLI